jgi:hypothetical protein
MRALKAASSASGARDTTASVMSRCPMWGMAPSKWSVKNEPLGQPFFQPGGELFFPGQQLLAGGDPFVPGDDAAGGWVCIHD